MKHITFSYDNTRSKGLGWACLGGALGCVFSYGNYWLGAALFLIGIAADTRIKKDQA